MKKALLVGFLIATVILAFFWWRNYNQYIYTDDANIRSERIEVTPLWEGLIVTTFAQVGDSIKRGQVLFQIEGENPHEVRAVSAGVIAKQWLLAGDLVRPGESVYTLNLNTSPYIMAYLEETKFSQVTLHQKATFTLDAYSKLTFFGHISYVGSNTASEFALIPPNNASGNFTKVTQRIPIRISIDSVAGNTHQKKHLQLVSGLSATVKIIK